MKKSLTIQQIYGSSAAAILICLLAFYFSRQDLWLHIAIGLSLLAMVWIKPFRYFAILWFAVGEGLGFFVSRVLLTLIYLIIVVPVSLFVGKSIRKRMQLNSFKTAQSSVFKERNHQFSANDFEKPF